MDELENQTIQMWRDSEKELTNIKSTLLQIGPDQRYMYVYTHTHTLSHNCFSAPKNQTMDYSPWFLAQI